MTENELNSLLEQLERSRIDLLPPFPQRRTGRQYRREKQIQKNDRLMKIVTRHYVPYAGYISHGFSGQTLLHSGKYIQYPKNSNRQRYLKKLAHRKVRKATGKLPSGNYYRRLFDYWWELD